MKSPTASTLEVASGLTHDTFNSRYSILLDSRYSILLGGTTEHLLPRDRQAIVANGVMADALVPIDRSLAHRLRSCRPGSRCRARKYCAYCGPIQAAKFRLKFRDELLKLPNAAHLTLTTCSYFHLTRKDIVVLTKRFDHLKERKRFKQAVPGGVVNIQIKYGANGWLPHLHAVIDYRGGLSKDWIRATWVSIGGGRFIDLQTITPGTEPRVLAYGASKQDLPLDPNLLRQFHLATAGFIFIRSWGTLHPLHGRKPRRGEPLNESA